MALAICIYVIMKFTLRCGKPFFATQSALPRCSFCGSGVMKNWFGSTFPFAVHVLNDTDLSIWVHCRFLKIDFWAARHASLAQTMTCVAHRFFAKWGLAKGEAPLRALSKGVGNIAPFGQCGAHEENAVSKRSTQCWSFSHPPQKELLLLSWLASTNCD